MSQPIEVTRVEYAVTTATAGPFDVPFRFFAKQDLAVLIDGRQTNAFTITGASNPAGGTLTLAEPISNATLIIYRDTVPERLTDFPQTGPFRIAKLNDELDHLTAVDQDLKARSDRSIRVPEDNQPIRRLPDAEDRANRMPAFDEDGDVTVTPFTVNQVASAIDAGVLPGTVATVAYSIGDGSAGPYPLPAEWAGLTSSLSLNVTLDGQLQDPTAYTISGGQITFAGPVPKFVRICARNITVGPTGPEGASAYQLWLAAGNEGTEADFLASLKGEPGDNGGGVTAEQLADGLATKADLLHIHAIADVTGLQAALDGKATAAQGAKADTAVQPAELANYATAAQGAKADTAVQPDALAPVATSGVYTDLTGRPSLATVATSGSYNDLSDKPVIPDGGGYATAEQGAKADTAVQPGAVTTSGLTMGTSRLLGRTSSSTGAVQEITVGSGLSLSGGSLTGASGLVLLQAVTVSSAVAQVDFTTGIDATYDAYVVEFDEVVPAIDGAALYVRARSAGAFQVAEYRFGMQSLTGQSGGSAAAAGDSNAPAFLVTGGTGVGNDTTHGESVSGMFEIFRPSSATRRKLCLWRTAHLDASGVFRGGFGIGSWGTTPSANMGAIDGLRFFFSSGNIAAGAFRLYGLRKTV